MAFAFALVLAVLSVLLGTFFLYGLLFPIGFMGRLRRFMAGPGPRGAVAIRLLLAALLWFSAPISATPSAFRSMAVVVLVAALGPLMLGPDGMLRLVDRMAHRPPLVTRLPCAAGLAISLFMLWSVSSAFGVL